jgi:hypothetical protein
MVDIEKETKGPAAPPQREKKEECCYLSIKIDQIILKSSAGPSMCLTAFPLYN